jgi:NADPH:quinone reductase-like Zn-dependent oxidoreductase
MGLLWWKPFKQEDVDSLRELIESGRIRPVIDRVFPLNEVPQALRYLQEKRAVGKVVVTM